MEINLLELNDREHATVLAAMRLFYEYLLGRVHISTELTLFIDDIQLSGGTVDPLNADETLDLGDAIAFCGSEDNKLAQAVQKLVECCHTYESDTWSSPEQKVDKAMATDMAAFLIRQHLFDAQGCPGTAIDGAEVGLAYDAVMEARTSK